MDEAVSFRDAQFRAAFDEAQDAVRAAEKELDEADADVQAYTAKRNKMDLIKALGLSGKRKLGGPPGDPPDPQRIVTARKKVAETKSNRAAMGLEATARYNTRARHADGEAGGQLWNLVPARETVHGVAGAAAGAATLSGHLHLSVLLLGGIIVFSPKASASPDRVSSPHWNFVDSSWMCATQGRCADKPDLAEAKDVKTFIDLKQQENSQKAHIRTLEAHIKTLEAKSASTLEQMRPAEETARGHQAPDLALIQVDDEMGSTTRYGKHNRRRGVRRTAPTAPPTTAPTADPTADPTASPTAPPTTAPTAAPTPPPCKHHTGISGPEYPGLKLRNGSNASPTWYVPYQEHELRADLKALDCNPASCDNPSACGIPVCRGISIGKYGVYDARQKGITRALCDGAGCDIEKYAQVVASNFPDDRNVQDVIDNTVDRSGQSTPMAATDAFPGESFLPGIRFGTYERPANSPGVVKTTPHSTDHTATGKLDGSWLWPDRRFCNPLEWRASYKTAMAHAGIRAGDKRSGVIFTKLALCLKANCAADGAACAPTKCYVSKKGKCVTFNQDVFNNWAWWPKKGHDQSADAYKLLESGDYTAECSEAAEDSSKSVIAGN